MRRLQAITLRLVLAGLTALSLGIVIVVASLATNGSDTPAFASSSPYEVFCPETPVGNIVLNNVVTSGTITPASPTAGQQFSLTGYSTSISLPSSIASAAQALGNSSLVGSASLKVDATGATPANISSGSLTINTPIPSPVPATGVMLNLPASPGTIGPFTATGGAISLTVDSAISLSLNVSGSTLQLTCTPYPNNTAATGIVSTAPTGSPASPVIATASAGSSSTTSISEPTTTTTAPSAKITGPYELYCPKTPVGDIALNGAVTSATLSPANPSAGQAFSVNGYQTVVNLPQSLASAAAALGSTLAGTATAQLDVFPTTAATPATVKPPAITFNVPIPSPVPSSGVPLSLPSTADDVSGFTASSPNFIVAEDSSASLTLMVSGAPLSLVCTAYPYNAIATSGITTTPPTGSPIDPVIAIASSGSPAPTTTTTGAGGTTTTTTEGATTTTEGATTTTEGATTTTEEATTTTSAGSTTSSSAPTSTVPGVAIQVGPGPMATYTVQPQPAPGSCHYTFSGPYPLPDPNCTPGAISPAVTQANIDTTICVSGYTEMPGLRPPDSITNKEKIGSAAAYGYTGSFSTAEYDHLIPLEIGGDPNDPSNLWVEPNDNPNATSVNNTKDNLENKLKTLVCSGQLTLAAAQQAIATNWVTAYQTYIGPVPGATTTSSSTPSTGATHSSGSSSTPTAGVVTSSSNSLAFTGTGPGLKTATLIGVALMLLGLVTLVLVDIPRRTLRHLALVRHWARHDYAAGFRAKTTQMGRDTARRITTWLLGR